MTVPRISEIFLVEVPPQDALAIRATLAESEIPGFLGTAFDKLAKSLRPAGLLAADSPFLRIAGHDPRALELVAGLAVSKTAAHSGEIESFRMPAGPRIFCYYQGDNMLMGPVYDEMRFLAFERGYELGDGVYEYYLNGPEYGVDRLLTRVMMPLKKK